MVKTQLSPATLAKAIGASESSIKRWVDDGRIVASRTAGGHRRIALTEAVRFVRESGGQLVRPELLGIADLVQGEETAARGGDDELLYKYLAAGAAERARGLIAALYLGGETVAAIVDGPVRQALMRLGEEWVNGPMGVFREHRATDIVLQGLEHLRGLLPSPDRGPVAVGGAPTGDPYLLPSRAVALVLRSCGLRAVNLGAETPMVALAEGVESLDPILVWLSVTSPPDRGRLELEIEELLQEFGCRGITLLLGGRSAGELNLAPHPRLHVGSSMAEVEAFARGFAAAAE